MNDRSVQQDRASFLAGVMGDARFGDTRYLDWLYSENPVGAPVLVDGFDEHGMLLHGAAIQQRLRNRERSEKFVVLANVAVAPRIRGNGVYAEKVLENAPRVVAEGCIAGYGVTNDNSTAPSLTGLGGSPAGVLPVKLCPPLSARIGGVTSRAVDEAYLGSAEFADVAAELDDHPAEDWTQVWTPEVLRWRLSRPDARYVVHVGPTAVAVSTRGSAYGMSVAVLLKLLPRRGAPAERFRAEGLVSAVLRYHRSPVALYGGFNARIGVRGWPLPRRFLPAPLNLVCLSLSDLEQDSFRFDTFEFLDFDAF